MNANSMNSNDGEASPERSGDFSEASGTGGTEGQEAAPRTGPTGSTGQSHGAGPSDIPGQSYQDAPYADRPSSVPPFPTPPRQNFFDWIRSHGLYRGRDRWVGGVASGIAHRAGIDPLIVRGIFIVLALFAGIGVLLYGLAWAFLPEPDGRIHVQEAGTGRWTAGMTGALITTIIGLPGLGRGFWGWGWNNGVSGLFWALVWAGVIVYFIYYLIQRNKNRNRAPQMNMQQPGTSAYAAPTFGTTAFADSTATQGTPVNQSGPYAPGPEAPSGTHEGPGYGGPGYAGPGYGGQGAVPPYGPSGPVPPMGGYRGPQERPHPRPRRIGPGAAIVAVSAGAALLTGGTLKALDAGNVIQLGDAGNAVVWASGAAVLGLGIIVAGLRGRTSGLVGFLAAAALIMGGIFSAIPHGDRFTFHDADWTPASIQQAQSGFEITGGRGTVDLRSLGLTAPLGSDVVVPLDITASNVTVVIPDTVPVEVRTDMAFGNLNQADNRRAGQFSNLSNSYNTDKSGAKLVVKINGAISNVTIQEGN